MIKLGLIGYPLGHSLSPSIHAAALKSCGLDGTYSLFPVHPDDKQGLKARLAHVRTGEITGLNVTIPHKQNVIGFLDELTPTATAIGAVNTIYKQDDKLMGDNTDASGFLSDLKGFLATKTQRHTELKALVLGAGGSARAVVYALLKDGWEITIAARRTEQARQLVDSIGKFPITICSFSSLESSSVRRRSRISLMVNTTPIGMTPSTDQSPWPDDLPFPAGAAVYDLVYNPKETKLVRDACSQGLSATTGLGMLVEQAILAFETWTGHRPSRDVMFASAEQSLVSKP